MNDNLSNSKSQIDVLDRASFSDDRQNHSTLPAGSSTEYGVMSARPFAVTRDQVFAGQRSVVMIALAESSPSAQHKKAVAALSESHRQAKAVGAQADGVMRNQVKAQYQKLVDSASDRMIAGDVSALDELESEKDMETRFEAETAAINGAVQKIGHAQIPHAIIVRDEIDSALAKLAKRLEDRDAAECKKFGISLEYSVATRLVQSVRVQFHRRTHALKRFATSTPGENQGGAFARAMFEDFLEPSAW